MGGKRMIHLFFKPMKEVEIVNSRKGFILGFFVYALLLGLTSFQIGFMDKVTLSPQVIFFSGMVAAFGYPALLNWKMRKSRYSA